MATCFSSYAAEKNEIVIMGDFQTGRVKSLFKPFTVWQSGSSIEVIWQSSLTNITVEVSDETGNIVYSVVVSPTSGELLTINASDWEAGDYIISITNASGSCYGEFNI
jgi:hypothetical protein